VSAPIGNRARIAEHETDVLSLWEAGASIGAIVRHTGYDWDYVEQIVAPHFVPDRPLSEFEKMAAAGTASLLASLHVFHPETRRGVHP
jgi:hypothetical protein